MRGSAVLESADAILDFFDAHYNFIDKQKILGKRQTPANAAGIKIDLGDTYNLLRFIEVAYDEK